MQTSGESRLAGTLGQVKSRYESLHASVRELRSRWEGYVEEHQNYRQGYNELTSWLQSTKQRVDAVGAITGDQDELRLKQQQLQRILEDKDEGFEMLSTTVEQGEKLYPDTANIGRDKIRQQLRTAKDVWDNLISDATEKQRKLDAALNQLASYTEGMDELHKWMAETGTWIKTDTAHKNTLPEKRSQLHTIRALVQDIASHGRVLGSVMDKAQSVYQATQAPEVHKVMSETNGQYDDLQNLAKDMATRLEKEVSEHAQYTEAHQQASEWLEVMGERLRLCADMQGDRHSIANKLERAEVR